MCPLHGYIHTWVHEDIQSYMCNCFSYICIYISIYIYAYIYLYICIWKCVCAYIYAYAHLYTHLPCADMTIVESIHTNCTCCMATPPPLTCPVRHALALRRTASTVLFRTHGDFGHAKAPILEVAGLGAQMLGTCLLVRVCLSMKNRHAYEHAYIEP